ncbi:hypothetical protein N9L68_06470, partial [bacterium]|nr:hypothetical protein [bacterium]
LLGVEVAVVWARRLVTMVVAQAKAQSWAAALADAKRSGRMTDGESERTAGRLSFAVTASGQQSCRAFIKPFYAQANAPLRGYWCGASLLLAIDWWLQYLRFRPRWDIGRWRAGLWWPGRTRRGKIGGWQRW